MCWSFKQSKILFRVQQKCISTALACSACSVLCSVLIVRAASLMIFLSLNFTLSYVFRNIGEWYCKRRARHYSDVGMSTNTQHAPRTRSCVQVPGEGGGWRRIAGGEGWGCLANNQHLNSTDDWHIQYWKQWREHFKEGLDGGRADLFDRKKIIFADRSSNYLVLFSNLMTVRIRTVFINYIQFMFIIVWKDSVHILPCPYKRLFIRLLYRSKKRSLVMFPLLDGWMQPFSR